MGEMKYCNNCDKMVQPIHRWNWAAFLLLLIFTFGIGAVLYIIYAAVAEGSCPQCNSKNWGVPLVETIIFSLQDGFLYVG